MFTSVLDTGVSQGATNVGFRALKDKVYTYNCYRNALPYFYIKRRCITSDGIYTRTYEDMILKPVPKHYFCIYLDAPQLSLDDERSITVEGYKLQTLRQAHCLMKFKSAIQLRELNKKATKPASLQQTETLKKILTTTDPDVLSQIEKKIEASEEFYDQEFSIMYNLTALKIDTYPDILQDLLKVGRRYIANTCARNNRLGTGHNYAITRWVPNLHLQGTNIYGHCLATFARLTESTLTQ